jgi:lysophospholipase L1-like esterase
MRLLPRLWLPLLACLIGGCATPPSPPPRSSPPPVDPRFDLPASDDLLPGAGPFRRADWFRPIWQERRQEFARRASQERRALVFLGDSITQGWGDDMSAAFGPTRVANRGIGGDTSRGVLYRLREDVIALEPRGVVLLVGTNDIEDGAAPEVVAENVRLIIEELLRHDPRLPILLCEVFPSTTRLRRPALILRHLNNLYAQLAAQYWQVRLVPTWELYATDHGEARAEQFPDLLHPNEAGYAVWADALRPHLRELNLLK